MADETLDIKLDIDENIDVSFYTDETMTANMGEVMRVDTEHTRANYNQTDPDAKDYIIGRENIVGKDELASVTEDILAQAKASGEFDGADGKDGKDGEDGQDGTNGKDGVSVTHRWNGTSLEVTSASGTSSANLKGEQGASAYEVALANGFEGTEAEWLESLIGEKGDSGYTPVKGVDYFDGKDGRDGVDGKTPVKGVDYFDGVDGKDGYTPVKGKDYFDGQDGYTPVKGVDYFDGKNGTNGKDGVSVTHRWNGTSLEVTSASGTSSANLKGEQGASAYEVALANGFEGTEAEWLESLQDEISRYIEYTEGNWTIRKWNNGQCELWYKVGWLNTIGKACGVVYESESLISLGTYPVTFTSAPFMTASFAKTNDNFYAGRVSAIIVTYGDTTNAPTIVLTSPISCMPSGTLYAYFKGTLSGYEPPTAYATEEDLYTLIDNRISSYLDDALGGDY